MTDAETDGGLPVEKLESAINLLRRQQRHDVADYLEAAHMEDGS